MSGKACFKAKDCNKEVKGVDENIEQEKLRKNTRVSESSSTFQGLGENIRGPWKNTIYQEEIQILYENESEVIYDVGRFQRNQQLIGEEFWKQNLSKLG